MSNREQKRKFSTNPLFSLTVALGIILLGGLLIFGVAHMLTMERSYKDLVRTMQSKTFGNKWVAALELSKQISSSSLKEEDISWLIENLSNIYATSQDPRTRNFIIVALGALGDKRGLPVFLKGLDDEDSHVKFHSIVGIANTKNVYDFDWPKLESFLDSEDIALVHTSLLTLATHKIPESEEKILSKLFHREISIRYAAATALIYYHNKAAVPMIREILHLTTEKAGSFGFNEEKLYGLKMNVLKATQKTRWSALKRELEKFVQKEKHLKIKAKALETLALL